MALSDNQKAFYDTRRYFQGKDNPDVPPSPTATATGVPRGQLITGILFVAVIALGFFLLARPAPIVTPPASAPTPAAAAPASH